MLSERTVRARQWRRFRRDKYFTQKRLASVLGIHVQTVKQIESGRVQPRAETLHKFEVLKEKHGGTSSRESPVWGRDYRSSGRQDQAASPEGLLPVSEPS